MKTLSFNCHCLILEYQKCNGLLNILESTCFEFTKNCTLVIEFRMRELIFEQIGTYPCNVPLICNDVHLGSIK